MYYYVFMYAYIYECVYMYACRQTCMSLHTYICKYVDRHA